MSLLLAKIEAELSAQLFAQLIVNNYKIITEPRIVFKKSLRNSRKEVAERQSLSNA